MKPNDLRTTLKYKINSLFPDLTSPKAADVLAATLRIDLYWRLLSVLEDRLTKDLNETN